MKKFPFTPTGVAELNSQLYLLSDAELAIEAQAIETDLIAWTSLHFILSANQLDYLESINAKAIRFAAFQISFAVAHRRPVNLIKNQAKSSSSGGEGTKLIETKSKLSVTNVPDASPIVAGEVELVVTYQ